MVACGSVASPSTEVLFVIVQDLVDLHYHNIPFIIGGTEYKDHKEIPIDILKAPVDRLDVRQDPEDHLYKVYIELFNK